MSERTIFIAALDIDDPAGRRAYVDESCRGNPDMRKRVEALIRSHEQAAGFLNSAPPGIEATEIRPDAEVPGSTIGLYKLLEPIGEGGFGRVFLAEQERPVRRKVALKIIKPGMDTRHVIARFEAERQALAMMDHPNIAKVHDAGATENGRPYFVMELVQGVPITEYCDECQLTTNERLELFITVCQAVQHAHQKGVIHRDLKPTNILVAMQDGRPAPKIIDFGVAKAVGQRLTEHTLTTAFSQMVGSPLYMSPEQAELSPLGVDTRSDIYSLGVMLYELLSGTTPFEKDRLHAASYDELRRIIREEEPPRPSARISTLAADMSTTVAEHRRTDARRLTQQVRGELDWIVMKCLEKDRNRRYETPSSLARDIERYLHDEPVQACPPSLSYRLKKFIRRNKAAAAFIGLLIASVAALTASNIQSRRSEQRAITESARAQAVSDLLQELLASADAARTKGVDYKVRELLDDFSAGLGNQLTDQPEAAADIHATIGRAYRSLKLPDKAQPHFEQAINLRRDVVGPEREKLAAIVVDYAWNLQDQQRYGEAESQLNEALDIYRQCGVDGAPLFHALEVLQHVLINAGRHDDAERATQQALAVADQAHAEFPDQANLLHRYAGLKVRQGHFAEAEQIALRSVDMHRRLHGERHPETAFGLRDLARALSPQRKYAEAEQAVREALQIFRRLFPEDHTNVRGAIEHLREVLQARNDTEALKVLDHEEAEHALQADRPEYHVRLARLLLENNPSDGQKQEARRLIRRAMDNYGQMAADSPNDKMNTWEAVDGYLAVAELCLTDPDDFAPEIDEAYRRRTEELEKLLAAFPDAASLHYEAAFKYRRWAFLVEGVSRCWPQYENALRRAVRLLEEVSLKDPKLPRLWFFLASSCVYFGDAAWVSAKSKEAETAFMRAMEIYDQHRTEIENESESNDIWEIVRLYTCVAYYLSATDRAQQAADYVVRASASTKRQTDPSALADSLYYVALLQARLGDTAGYRATCETIVKVPISEIVPQGRLRPIVTPCLLPGALEDPRVPIKLAEEVFATNPLNDASVGPYSLGIAYYRAGQFEQAAKQLENAIDLYPSDPPLGTHSINSLHLLLAMTKWQLGQQDAARELLSESLPAVEEERQNPTSVWNRRATLELLHGEAKALIGPTETNEAVEIEVEPVTSPSHENLTPDT
jgi:serine/threonine protein kinase